MMSILRRYLLIHQLNLFLWHCQLRPLYDRTSVSEAIPKGMGNWFKHIYLQSNNSRETISTPLAMGDSAGTKPWQNTTKVEPWAWFFGCIVCTLLLLYRYTYTYTYTYIPNTAIMRTKTCLLPWQHAQSLVAVIVWKTAMAILPVCLLVISSNNHI